MNLGRYKQHSEDVRRRQVDYTSFLETGETISQVTPTVTPTTENLLTAGSIVIDSGGKKFAYVVQGGDNGYSYSVNFEITTSAGQVKNDTVEFDIEDDTDG